jgi:hypothetical protein
VMRGGACVRVDLDVTERVFDGMLDGGGMTRRRIIPVFVFVLGRGKLKDGVQMMSGE